MVHETGDEDVLTSSLSPAENVAAADAEGGTSLVDREANGPSIMDAVPVQIVSEADHKVETAKEGGEAMKFESNDGWDANGEERDAAVDEGGDNVYFSDEDEDGDEEEDDLDDSDDDDDDDEYDDEGEDEDDFMDEDDIDEDDYSGLVSKIDDVDEAKEGVNIGRESGKKENEEKGVSLEPKVDQLKKKVTVTKVVVSKKSGEVAVTKKGKSETDGENGPMDKEKRNETDEVGEKGEGSLKKKVNRLRQGDVKKVLRPSSEKAAPEPKDKLNSKLRKKVGGSKRAESMGMIFMCSSKTKKDCYHYKVLGLPAAKRDLVEKIYKGMRLFLYDVDLKLMYGIYKAAARGGYNLEPKAFNSKFPAQVRFAVLEDCIPLAEEKFRRVIKENYFTKNKFDCQLSHEQVKNLCKLFIAANKGPKSIRLDRRRKAKPQAPIRRDRSRARAIDEERHRNRSSARGVDGGRRIAVDENYQHHDDYYHVREREIVAPPVVVRVPRVAAPLPPPIDTPRYTYDRILERDAYRPTALVEHRDPYRQPLLVSRDAYRPHSLSDYRDSYREETALDRYDTYRRDRIPENRDLRPVNLEVRRRDDFAAHEPYDYYRERESYRDPLYSEHRLPVEPTRESYRDPVYSEHRLPVEPSRYRSVRTEYRSRGSPVSDYRATRAMYRY